MEVKRLFCSMVELWKSFLIKNNRRIKVNEKEKKGKIRDISIIAVLTVTGLIWMVYML